MNAKHNFRLDTQRLFLRETSVDDAEQAYLLNLDPDVLKYTGDVAFESVDEARSFLAGYEQFRLYGMGRWAVIRKLDGVFLGWCGLKFHPEQNETDLGFRFFKKYWNQGYATEAARECLDWGFNKKQLPIIVGNAEAENFASCAVLKKLGMKPALQTPASPCALRFEIYRSDYLARL